MRPSRPLTQRRGLLGLAAAALALAVVPSTASAAIVHVTNLGNSGPGTLRHAIATAPPGSTIIVPAGTIKLTSGQLVVNKKLEIDGAGAATTTISGNDASRVFSLVGAAGVKITELAIVHGRLAQAGAALTGAAALIDAASSLTLDTVRVTNNSVDVSADATHTAGTVQGGVFYSSGGLTLRRSTVANNFIKADGSSAHPGGGSITGGVLYSLGTLSLTGTTVNANTASAAGSGGGSGGSVTGGLVDAPTGSLAFSGSTLNDNSISANGGSSREVASGEVPSRERGHGCLISAAVRGMRRTSPSIRRRRGQGLRCRSLRRQRQGGA